MLLKSYFHKDKTKIDLIYKVQKEFSIVSKNRKIKPNFILKKNKQTKTFTFFF